MDEHTWVARPERRWVGSAALGTVLSPLAVFYVGWIALIITAVCGVALIGGLVHWRLQLARHRSDRVRITAAGLQLEQEGASRSVPWDSITALVAMRAREYPGFGRQGFMGRGPLDEVTPRWSYRVRCGSEEVLVIDEHWNEFETLSKTVDEKVRTLLVPKMRVALRAGERCAFGSLEASAEGVHFQSRTLAWKDVQRIRLEQGLVVVERKPVGRFATPDVRTIENVSTLIAIADWAPKTLAKETYRS